MRRVGRLVLDRTVDNFFAETEQVAFCTQNVVPGHRLHQRSAAAGPQLLLPRHAAEAARQPELHPPAGERPTLPGGPLPAGRAHGDDEPGRAGELRTQLVVRRRGRGRIRPAATARSPSRVGGVKQRVRSERFADHYSQARQFYVSQTPVEQAHIVDAFVFELSKCEQPGIRARMVANLRNVDEDFARRVADGLRLASYPEPSAAGPPADHRPRAVACPEHPAQRPDRASPGASSGCSSPTARTPPCSQAIRKAATAEGAIVELVAPQVGGVVTSDGELLPAHQKIDGGPSVLYDAVVVMASDEGAALLGGRRRRPRTSSRDAHAHCKFVGYTTELEGRCSMPPGSPR